MGRALNVIGVPTGAATYTAALEGLTSLNESILRGAPQTPPLYAAGVRYTDRVTDKWRTLTDVLASGSGDCEALSTWRAAELRVSGEDPAASVMVYRTGKNKFHAVVLRGDGSIEDPSILLGMKAPRGLVERYQEWNQAVTAPPVEPDGAAVMGGGDGYDPDDVACIGIGPDVADGADELSFGVEELRAGNRKAYRGHARIPIGDGRAIYAQTSTAPSTREAERRAAAVVGAVGSIWDDVNVLVSPFPMTAAALRLAQNQHVQNLAKAAYGKARRRGGGGGDQQAGAARHVRVHAGDPVYLADRSGAPGSDLSDLSPDDQAAADQDGYYQPQVDPGAGAYDELMAARAEDEAASGVYGFGPTPSEQRALDTINGYLATISTPVVGAFFRQQGGANFRTFTPAKPTQTKRGGGASSNWGMQPAGYSPAPAPPGMPGMNPYGGPVYSPGLSPFGFGSGGGGFSSTGTPYGSFAHLLAQQQGGGGGGGGGGGDFGGGGGYYPTSSPDAGGGYYPTDADAFFGTNPSGLSFDEKAELLETYGSGG